ncbi:thioredoxin family protein [Haloplanus halobius]|uniref:thioredoxin family protein n=1 Tax=Haloplanus halobius TaxID=2934938 RepID=UPI0020105CA1|nr:thioredoxin family protein [Haloplanus sp. XH21]
MTDDGTVLGRIDATALDDVVGDHDRLLVECYTEGCGACAAMEPVLSNVARETGITVALVNPRDDPVLIEAYDIRRVPTLVLFEEGEQVARLDEGFVGAERVIEFLD